MGIGTIVIDDASAAAANRTSLDAASGAVILPPGRIYTDQHVRHDRRQNIALTGYGTTIFNNNVSGTEHTAIWHGHEGNYTYGEAPFPGLGWIYNGFLPVSFVRSICERFNGAVPPLTGIYTTGKNIYRGFVITAAKAGKNVIGVTLGAGAPGIGEAVRVTDGPGIDEIAPTEWAVVTAVGANTLTLDRRLTRTYATGKAILIAAAVGWPQDLTYRGITYDAATGFRGFLSSCFRVKFYDCVFTATAAAGSHANTLDTTASSELLFERCKIPCGVRINSTQAVFRFCDLGSLDAEEYAQRVVVEDCLIWPRQLDAKIFCSDWIVRRCVLAGTTVGIYDHWRFWDNRVVGPGDFYVRGYAADLRRVTSDRLIHVNSSYQGSPANAGKRCRFEKVTAPAFWLDAGTTGTMIDCTGIVVGDTSGWTIITPNPDAT